MLSYKKGGLLSRLMNGVETPLTASRTPEKIFSKSYWSIFFRPDVIIRKSDVWRIAHSVLDNLIEKLPFCRQRYPSARQSPLFNSSVQVNRCVNCETGIRLMHRD
jgi:hypothetical protein